MQLGSRLARLHRFGSERFGAPWAGFIGPLAMDNTPGARWLPFYANQRVLPFVRAATDRGAMSNTGAREVELALEKAEHEDAAAEPPSRIHGDLWSGNVVWQPAVPCLIDPAAHGGHRETDLAMLSLFGLAHLDLVLRSYEEAYPLAPGWRRRIPLHQLHPLAVHAVLFGSHYGSQCVQAARQYLAGRD